MAEPGIARPMRKILTIADSYPRPDQASGDLRFFTLLSLMAREYEVVFCALNAEGAVKARDQAGVGLERIGITLGEVDLLHTLGQFTPDIVWFEFHHQVRRDYLSLIERHCPKARIVVDSVDVHFNRLEAHARLTGKAEDQEAANAMKVRELAAYACADMVIAVTVADSRLILEELPRTRVAVVPNIHDIPAFPDPLKRNPGELLFVGGFKHDPNVDAVLYFCREIMPRIVAIRPQTCLKIIGSHPPREIFTLASAAIAVAGYVPNMAPHLESAFISIAPLRYGGGMKGKVGEAMSYGIPVVTTRFGAEGFGLEPEHDLLIGDTPEDFATQVVRLLDDAELHARIAKNGYDFIERCYSVPVVAGLLDACLRQLAELPRRSWTSRVLAPLRTLYRRQLEWRFQR